MGLRRSLRHFYEDNRREIFIVGGGATLAFLIATGVPSGCSTPLPGIDGEVLEQLEDLARDAQQR